MRKLLAGLLVLVLAVPAFADWINKPVAVLDGQGVKVSDGTFFRIEGDSLRARAAADTIAWTDVDLTGQTGWFNFKVPEVTSLVSLHFAFKESQTGITHSYSWGDTFLYPVSGEACRDAFQIGGADSFRFRATASSDAMFSLYYWIERD